MFRGRDYFRFITTPIPNLGVIGFHPQGITEKKIQMNGESKLSYIKSKQGRRVYIFSYCVQKGQSTLSGEMYSFNKNQNEAAVQIYLQVKEKNEGWTVTDLKCLCHMSIQDFNDSELPFSFEGEEQE